MLTCKCIKKCCGAKIPDAKINLFIRKFEMGFLSDCVSLICLPLVFVSSDVIALGSVATYPLVSVTDKQAARSTSW